MNLQPSLANTYVERRILFANELLLGGHGQIPISGAGTITPTSTAYYFYAIDFLQNSTLSSVSGVNFVNTNDFYQATEASYNNFAFPAGYTWLAPIQSLSLASGQAIAYQYKLFDPAVEACASCDA